MPLQDLNEGVLMKIEKGRGWVRFELGGDIDLAWLESHRAAVTDALKGNPSLVLVDVEHVRFMDSTGLSLLVQAYHECQAANGEVCVINPQPFVARTLGIAGLDQIVTVVNNCREVREIYNRLASLDVSDDLVARRSSATDGANA